MSIERMIEDWLEENGYDGCGVRCPNCGEESEIGDVIFEPYVCIKFDCEEEGGATEDCE